MRGLSAVFGSIAVVLVVAALAVARLAPATQGLSLEEIAPPTG